MASLKDAVKKKLFGGKVNFRSEEAPSEEVAAGEGDSELDAPEGTEGKE